MLNDGADVNLELETGRTALIAAVSSGNSAAYKTLIKNGANPKLANRHGVCAEDVARLCGTEVLLDFSMQAAALQKANHSTTSEAATDHLRTGMSSDEHPTHLSMSVSPRSIGSSTTSPKSPKSPKSLGGKRPSQMELEFHPSIGSSTSPKSPKSPKSLGGKRPSQMELEVHPEILEMGKPQLQLQNIAETRSRPSSSSSSHKKKKKTLGEKRPSSVGENQMLTRALADKGAPSAPLAFGVAP